MSYTKKGAWNVICPVCGFEKKSTDMRKRWDGQMVCKKDWEPRHPQEMIRGVPDDMSVPFAYPEPEDNFVDQSAYSDQTTTVPTGTFNEDTL